MLPIGCVLVNPFSHAVWRLLSLRVHVLESFVVVQGIPLDVDVSLPSGRIGSWSVRSMKG